MNKCKLSIIVPVYGVEKYIDKCLNSLVKQSLKEIEIIVVNDGTKDNSQKIIDKYVKKYPDKIKSYIKENGGQGSARNYGLKKTTGEYIGYVDSDDFVEKDMYKKLYNKAKENNYDMSYKINFGYNYFPAKEYRNIKYKEGYYESIVITIGNGEGNNWWCFLFPNLCLVDLQNKTDIEYKSWLVKQINKIF